MASNGLNLHQVGKDRKDGQKGEDAEENEHPNTHSFLIFLILLVLLDTIFILADAFLCFRWNVDATDSTMFVGGDMSKRFHALWHVLDFLFNCRYIDHNITPVELRCPQTVVLPMHLQSDGCLVHRERQFSIHSQLPS